MDRICPPRPTNLSAEKLETNREVGELKGNSNVHRFHRFGATRGEKLVGFTSGTDGSGACFEILKLIQFSGYGNDFSEREIETRRAPAESIRSHRLDPLSRGFFRFDSFPRKFRMDHVKGEKYDQQLFRNRISSASIRPRNA